ncbi:MAG TPA: hypothetical protein VN848_12460 [Gemmatimonadales bacterium]|nr:hypothetical protein [Gemmatimonadales bacterium]
MRSYPLLFGVLALAACSHMVPAPLRPAQDTYAPVASSATLYYDDGPAFRDSVRLVVRDATSWPGIWARATSTQTTPPPLPAIDFAHEMVLVVGAGHMSPGDQIRVDSAGEQKGAYNVAVRTILTCHPFAADAYPLEVVRVSRTEKPVTFNERRERAACN